VSSVRRLLLGATLGVAVWAPVAASPLLTCAAAAGTVPAGSVAVSVVIDTGTTPPSPGGTQSTCVTLPEGSTGIDALQARARQLGRPEPRFNTSGLLCAIDGFPETGCGEATGSDFLYWSYWVGSQSQWYYANLGPGSRKVTNGTVEGWRFLQGTGRSSDQAPRATPTPCAGPPTTTLSPSPAEVASESISRASSGTGVAALPTLPRPATPTRPGPTGAPTGAVSAPSVAAPSVVAPSTAAPSNTGPSITSSTTTAGRPIRVESASASRSPNDRDSSGLVTILGVVGVTSLGIAGLWASRRRAGG